MKTQAVGYCFTHLPTCLSNEMFHKCYSELANIISYGHGNFTILDYYPQQDIAKYVQQIIKEAISEYTSCYKNVSCSEQCDTICRYARNNPDMDLIDIIYDSSWDSFGRLSTGCKRLSELIITGKVDCVITHSTCTQEPDNIAFFNKLFHTYNTELIRVYSNDDYDLLFEWFKTEMDMSYLNGILQN